MTKLPLKDANKDGFWLLRGPTKAGFNYLKRISCRDLFILTS